MDIYNYAPTGEYIGAAKADPDPLEEGEWLIPAHATASSPPKAESGEAAVFDGSAWAMVEDHRGRSGWIDGQPATMADLGPLPDGWSDDAPPVPLPTLAEAQAAKLAEIIACSNKAAAWLKSQFSEAEAESWPQQEAGARMILGGEADVRDDTAASILKDEARTVVAVGLVHTLASIDGVTDAAFAARIVANADAAYSAKILTLTEQRSHERLLKDAVASGAVGAVQGLAVHFSLPPSDA